MRPDSRPNGPFLFNQAYIQSRVSSPLPHTRSLMDHLTGQTRIVKTLVSLQDTVRAKDQLIRTFERQIVQLTADSSSWRNRYAVLKHAYVITKQRYDALLKTTEVLKQSNVTLERDNTAL